MSLEKTEIFVNLSKSGDAIVFQIENKIYTAAFSLLKRLHDYDIKTFTLTEMVKEQKPFEV